MTAKEYYDKIKELLASLYRDKIDPLYKAVFGTESSKGILVRLARIELQIYGLYLITTGIFGLLIKLIWFSNGGK